MASLGFFELMIIGALVIILAVLLIWAVIAFLRTRISITREEQYHELAAQAVAAQEATERRMAEVAAELSTMRTHMASLERVLTEIE